MNRRLQLGCSLLALVLGAGLGSPYARAQHFRAAGGGGQTHPAAPPKPSNPTPNRPPSPQGGGRNLQRPPQNQAQRQQPTAPQQTNKPAQTNPNRPPASYRPQNGFGQNNGGGNNAINRPRNLTPEERQNLQRFNKLPPQQQQEMRDKARVWQQMTPDQRSHIKNDVLPKWKQLPQDRKRAIQQRLGVLKNMPESARNQHLNDPNFTRGMSEEDQSTLRDLSHLHVGGAPDTPNE